MNLDLDALEAAAKAATGPFHNPSASDDDHPCRDEREWPSPKTIEELVTQINWIAAESLGRVFGGADKARVAALIAGLNPLANPQTILALIAELRTLQQRLAEAERALRQIEGGHFDTPEDDLEAALVAHQKCAREALESTCQNP